jgi:hypothetical protein
VNAFDGSSEISATTLPTLGSQAKSRNSRAYVRSRILPRSAVGFDVSGATIFLTGAAPQ